MPFRLEPRAEPSRAARLATPFAAILLAMALGVLLFDALGYDGAEAVKQMFVAPLAQSYKWEDVAAKTAPLVLIALGLSLAATAKIWNIGAEGQYIVGALAGAGVAQATAAAQSHWAVALMIVAGALGGAFWAAFPALLRTRFSVNEVLSSLMLVYVAQQALNWLVTGPWKDPKGFNFPQTAPFSDWQTLPRTLAGTPVPPGLVVAIVLTLVFWIVLTRSTFGFGVRAIGAAPAAARYGGSEETRIVWATLLISGAMAGLAGALEAVSQTGRLNLGFPSGYGFTAIIVAFLGRLHPVGVFFAGLVLAVTSVGGQMAQTTVHTPSAAAGLFQAMMLFFILASDFAVRYRLRFLRALTGRRVA